jgi:hypothetical protein
MFHVGSSTIPVHKEPRTEEENKISSQRLNQKPSTLSMIADCLTNL